MASHALRSYVPVSEYLEGELAGEVRHEYVAGEVFAMAGASEAHNLIALNVAMALRQHLTDAACRVLMSDVKVRVDQAQSFYYPDVFVTCDATDVEPYYKTRPCLVVEVLSPATEAIDRREKLLAYRKADSLREYVLVSQDVFRVEVYRREQDSSWSVHVYEGNEHAQLQSVNYTIPLNAIYDKVPTGR